VDWDHEKAWWETFWWYPPKPQDVSWKTVFKGSLHNGTIPIEDFRTAAKGYLTLDEDGELEVNKKAQLQSQMLTCIQAPINDECALKVVTSGDYYEVEIENGES